MNYPEAKARADALWHALKVTGEALEAFPKGPLGLTPDAVKATPEYKAAKQAFDKAHSELRAFNSWYVKACKKEIAADRAARRMQA